jgi:hypothetical protein
VIVKTFILTLLLAVDVQARGLRSSDQPIDLRPLISSVIAQMASSHGGIQSSNVNGLSFTQVDGVHLQGFCSDVYNQSTCQKAIFNTVDGYNCSVRIAPFIDPQESGVKQRSRIQRNFDLTFCEKDGGFFIMNSRGQIRAAR